MTSIEIPKPRSPKEIASEVQRLAVERFKAARAKQYALPSGSCWVLTCHLAPRTHIGMIFADGVDPRSENEIHGGMWFSSYHDLDDVYRGGREGLICDTCLRTTGERTTLRVEMVRSRNPDIGECFRVPAHWSRFLRVEDFKALAVMLKEEEPAQAPPPVVRAQAKSATPEKEKG
jgi:hypothetical protein